MPILNWLGREEALKTAQKTPYRLLEEVPELGYSDKNSENMIVQGDNLEALKALLPFYAEQVKCIYIDPPYNTGARIDVDGNEIGYDDNLEHSTWLSMMYPRLEILREFLKEDGSIWISIDEKEGHYLKVIADEIFGRDNFIIQTTIQRGGVTGHKSINPTPVQVCDLMISYAKNKELWKYHPVYKKREYDKAYNQYIDNYDEAFENWHFISLNEAMKKYSFTLDDCLSKFPERLIRFAQPDYNSVGSATKNLIDISKNDSSKVYLQKREDNPDIYLFKGNRILFYKDKLKIIDGKYTTIEQVTNIWTDMNYQGIAKEGNVVFKKGKKPEVQIKRLLEMSTNQGDLVLDSFLGSGTTAAVAHKMGRRYIGIEMGEHAKTHCVPRLKAVVDGEQGGISKSVNWQGGGGFRFYTLGNEVFDAEGHINEGISFENLSAHIWFTETKTSFNKSTEKSTFLGFNEKVAYALLYNGILRDKRVDGGNVLTNKTLQVILDDMEHQPYDKLIIYGESSRISQPRLKSLNIEFKQTPYDIKAR